MSPTLKIYMMAHCPTCEESRKTAASIRERCPMLEVELIDLEESDKTVPSEVFSVPTYMLDGVVIALGNPYLDQLEAVIRRRAQIPLG